MEQILPFIPMISVAEVAHVYRPYDFVYSVYLIVTPLSGCSKAEK